MAQRAIRERAERLDVSCRVSKKASARDAPKTACGETPQPRYQGVAASPRRDWPCGLGCQWKANGKALLCNAFTFHFFTY
jgi:hypothetical protein